MIYAEDPFRRRPRKLTARWKRQERCVWMTTKLAKSASNNGQIIKSWLPNDRRAKFLPSVAEIAYDLLRIEGYLGNVGYKQETGRWLNNRAENSHLPFRRRERAMQSFRTTRSLQKFTAIHSSVCNHFNFQKHVISRDEFKIQRNAALAGWQQLCAA